jgi:hypothetical protein
VLWFVVCQEVDAASVVPPCVLNNTQQGYEYDGAERYEIPSRPRQTRCISRPFRSERLATEQYNEQTPIVLKLSDVKAKWAVHAIIF